MATINYAWQFDGATFEVEIDFAPADRSVGINQPGLTVEAVLVSGADVLPLLSKQTVARIVDDFRTQQLEAA